MSQVKNSLELIQEQIDINHLMRTDDFDINNSILADEADEAMQEEEFHKERFLEKYSMTWEQLEEEEYDYN
mgnify:FL=1